MFNLRDNETVEEIRSLLDLVMQNEDFANFVHEPSEKNWNRIYNTEDFTFYCGCTKGVIVPYDSDFVFKIPFNINEHHSVDYCHLEAINYRKAVDAGLEKYFAQTEYFGYYGVPIYIQERVECDQDAISDSICEIAYNNYIKHSGEEDNEETRDHYFCSIYEGNDGEAEDIMIEEWGSQAYWEFDDFCEENCINDVHTGNVGYRDGKLIVVDFSGYNVDFDWYMEQCV